VITVPARQIRALFSAQTITVYQAYSPAIAIPAAQAGRLVAPFKRERMTWIKPSFLWMMYRSGWASKPGQEHVLAIEIGRDGFEWALARSCLSHYDSDHHADHQSWAQQLKSSPVRIQWDPERSVQMQQLPYRSLQIGLSGEAVDRYLDEWTVGITDVTPLAHEIHGLVRRGNLDEATSLLPKEQPYPIPASIEAIVMAG
jgi:hypothetical protein